MSAELDEMEAPPLGTVLKGGYELVRFLGAGAMGAVYQARSPDGRHVAIKVLLQATLAGGQEMVDRFKREADVTATIDNPHVVGLVDASLDPVLGTPFLVLPLLSGLDVEGQLERTGPLHPTVAVRITRQICDALHAAHHAGVVHRDIKPGNLYLDHNRDGQVMARVLDFGIASFRAEEKSLTMTGSMLGTPLYMAPEQTTNAKGADSRADVYSLGITLYEMLSGKVPFEHLESFAELHLAINIEDIPPLQDAAPWIDPALAVVVHGAILKDRDVRCPSMDELSDALAPFAFGSDEISASMLEPLPGKMRSSTARRAELPESWRKVQPSMPPPAMVSSEQDPLLGKILGGIYTLNRRLGQGGMGAVYEAQDHDGHRFAIKVIEPELAGKSSSARRRFVREAKATAAIQHDNVVQVVRADTDLEKDLPYIVMELLQGMSLDVMLQRQGALDPMALARAFIQACHGLSAAHAQHFIHRDMKPGNLFLHELPAGEVVVKLCDFGIAKRLEAAGDERTTANLTRTGGVIGSPMYMSPEQAKNAKSVDHRSDVWSLGATLYEALTGKPPWAGQETVGELIIAICTQQLPHLQDRAPWVPSGMAEVVHKAMRRSADERYQTMEEFAAALEPFTGGVAALTPKMLSPVGLATRATAAARAQPTENVAVDGQQMQVAAAQARAVAVASAATVQSEPGMSEPGTYGSVGAIATSQDGPPAKRTPVGAIAAGGVVLLALGGAGAYFALGPVSPGAASEPGETATVAETPPSSEPTAEPTVEPTSTAIEAAEVRIPVDPPHAKVEVDGQARKLEDGKLVLEGKPGDEFEVVVSLGPRKLEQKVRIGESGAVQPDELELPPTAPAVRGAGALPRPQPKPTAKPPEPKPQPKPTATGGERPKAKDSWGD